MFTLRLRRIKNTSPRWIVVGGPVTYHQTRDEACAAAKKRGAGAAIVYVARGRRADDSVRLERSIEDQPPVRKAERSSKTADSAASQCSATQLHQPAIPHGLTQTLRCQLPAGHVGDHRAEFWEVVDSINDLRPPTKKRKRS